MRALSIRQPWAWAIAAAGNDVENRTWQTPYRGPVAIHAGLRVEDPWQLPGLGLVRAYETDLDRDQQGAAARGAIVAVAELIGCDRCRGECSPLWAAEGHWHWHLAIVRPVREPVPLRGRLGFWPLSPQVEALVTRQLRGTR